MDDTTAAPRLKSEGKSRASTSRRRFASAYESRFGAVDRARMEAAIEKLLAAADRLLLALDALDAPAEDLEEADHGGGDVLDEGEPNEWDNEPWLGAPERHPSLTWGAAALIDGRRVMVADADLGHSQQLWAQGESDDREDNGDDEPHNCDLPA